MKFPALVRSLNEKQMRQQNDKAAHTIPLLVKTERMQPGAFHSNINIDILLTVIC